MLDTVRLRSPFITAEKAVQIERACCDRRQAIDLRTGHILYEFTSGRLVGSYDHRVSVQVERSQLVSSGGRGGSVCRLPCEPYVVLEGSVHKAMMGHNCWGGPEDWLPAVRWFVDRVSDLLQVQLPSADEWVVRRVDWAECYDLGSFEAVQEFIHGLNLETFPRRRDLRRYGDHSLHSSGRVTVKVYHKGPEFEQHDRSRVRSSFGLNGLLDIQEKANGILRTEASISSKHLDEHFGRNLKTVAISVSDLIKVHDEQLARLVREGKATMTVVRNTREVRDRLYDVYSERLASVLYGTWLDMASLGEAAARSRLARPTFYRQRKQLLEAGCGWDGTDIVVTHSAIPAGFSLRRDSPFRLVGESAEVASMLASYRVAA